MMRKLKKNYFSEITFSSRRDNNLVYNPILRETQHFNFRMKIWSEVDFISYFNFYRPKKEKKTRIPKTHNQVINADEESAKMEEQCKQQ